MQFSSPPFPKVLRIEPASACNLACSHCPTGTVAMKRGVMTEETFNKIFLEVEKHKENIETIVLYHGGEPLINKMLFDWIAKLRSLKPDFFIKTVSNGMLLTSKVAESLARSELDIVEFSLDGESPEENQAIRRQSKTDLVLSQINYLLSYLRDNKIPNPKVYISTTQFLGKNYRSIQEPLPAPDVPSWLSEKLANGVAKFKPTWAMVWPHMEIDSESYGVVTVQDSGTSNICDHTINTLTIRFDGSVVPCCYDLTSQLVMGNIYNSSLEEIWSGESYNVLRTSISQKKYISICSNCNVVMPNRYLFYKNSSLGSQG